MKTVVLKVEIEVPDNYIVDDPYWTLETALEPCDGSIILKSVSKIEMYTM